MDVTGAYGSYRVLVRARTGACWGAKSHTLIAPRQPVGKARLSADVASHEGAICAETLPCIRPYRRRGSDHEGWWVYP